MRELTVSCATARIQGEEGRPGRGPSAGARGRRAATLAAALAVAVSLATPQRAAACTLTTTGAATVNDGDVFTLTLGAADTGDGLPTSWTINWGDGTISALAGNPATATHTYDVALPSIFTFNILASATCWSQHVLPERPGGHEQCQRPGELVRP